MNIKKNNTKNSDYYIILSPFIYNKIEWNKLKKDDYKKLVLSELNISDKEYSKNISLSKNNYFIPDINLYIKINSYMPEYKENNRKWLNCMYYSAINLSYIKKTGLHHKIFKREKININYLDLENIIIPLDLMIDKWLELLKDKKVSIYHIKNNNLLLMLLSDIKDIIFKIRKNEYEYNLDEIKKVIHVLKIENKIKESDLWKLDFQSLIKKNYDRFSKK